MRNPIKLAQTPDSIRLNSEETIENPRSFEELMQEVAITILVYLIMALAAELLTRGLALG